MPSFNFNPSSVLPSCRQKKLVTARALTFIFSSLGLLGITLASKSSRREIFWARAVCRLAGGLGGCGVLQTTDFKRKARPNQTPFEDTGGEGSRRATCAHAQHGPPVPPPGGNCQKRRRRRRRARGSTWEPGQPPPPPPGQPAGWRTCNWEWQQKPPVFFLLRGPAGPS